MAVAEQRTASGNECRARVDLGQQGDRLTKVVEKRSIRVEEKYARRHRGLRGRQ